MEITSTLWGWFKGTGPLWVQIWIRAGAWFLGIVIAALPSFSLSGAEFGTLSSMATAAAKAGHYKDFYFLTVVASVLGLTTTLVHVFKYTDNIAHWARFVFGVLCFYFIGVAVIGVNRFGELARLPDHQLPVFGLDLSILFWTLTAGLLAEIVVVLREHAP
ncbi:hypothetical protein ACIPUD_21110 [Bradyrhizobium sp. CAR08]